MKVIQNNHAREVVQICFNCKSVVLVDTKEDLFEAYRGAGYEQWKCPCCEEYNDFKEINK